MDIIGAFPICLITPMAIMRSITTTILVICIFDCNKRAFNRTIGTYVFWYKCIILAPSAALSRLIYYNFLNIIILVRKVIIQMLIIVFMWLIAQIMC